MINKGKGSKKKTHFTLCMTRNRAITPFIYSNKLVIKQNT